MTRYSKRRRSWKSLLRIAVVPVVALACIGGLLCEELAFRHRQKTSWASEAATVKQTRLHPIARYALEYGGKDLYEIDILAKYAANGVQHEDWVPLSEPPKALAEAQAAALRLTGRECLVRWDSAAPDQKIAELH
jgi:hypothetical protein